MDGMVADQNDVVWVQVIGTALYDIIHISAEKNQDFIKVMVMIGDIAGETGWEMEQPEFLIQIASFFVRIHRQAASFRELDVIRMVISL